MQTQIIQTRINHKCNEILISNNEELKPFLKFLSDIAKKNVESKYVKVKAYKVKNGAGSYIFEYWGADSLDKALRKESLENCIKEDIKDIKKWEDKENVETFIKKIYDAKNHFIINEILEDFEKIA